VVNVHLGQACLLKSLQRFGIAIPGMFFCRKLRRKDNSSDGRYMRNDEIRRDRCLLNNDDDARLSSQAQLLTHLLISRYATLSKLLSEESFTDIVSGP
jgi:hypothetical protein